MDVILLIDTMPIKALYMNHDYIKFKASYSMLLAQISWRSGHRNRLTMELDY